MKNIFLVTSVAALVIIFLTVSGCGGAPVPQVEESTFTIAMQNDLGSLVPGSGTSWGDPLYFLYEPLTRSSTIDQQLMSCLASSWESLDPMTWKFDIRKGIRFQNGDPFTSADAKFLFDRSIGLYEPDYVVASKATWQGLIEKAETPDENTLILRMKRPEVSFPALIHLTMLLPKDYALKVGSKEFDRAPVGTGPYKLKERKVGESITLEANPDYWNKNPEPGALGMPRVKTVKYRIIPEEQTRIAALRAGEVDAMMQLSVINARELEKDPNFNVIFTERGLPNYAIMNWRDAKDPETGQPNPMVDVRVRKALNYAVNWDDITKNFLTGREKRTTLVPRGAIGYNPNVPIYPYDPNKARQLMKEAGYANGFTLKFHSAQIKPEHEALFKYFKDIGVTIEPKLTTLPVILRMLSQKTLYGMCMTQSQTGPDPTPQFFETAIRYSGNVALHGQNPQVEALVDKSKAEFDVEKRAKIIDEVIRIVVEDAWFIPGYEVVDQKVISASWDYPDFPAMAAINLPALSKKK